MWHQTTYYVYEADRHCEDCAEKRFTPEALRTLSDSEAREAWPTDNERNYVTPIHVGRALSEWIYCGTCRKGIATETTIETAYYQLKCDMERNTHHPLVESYLEDTMGSHLRVIVDKEYLDYFGSWEYEYDDDVISTVLNAAVDRFVVEWLEAERELHDAAYDGDLFTHSV